MKLFKYVFGSVASLILLFLLVSFLLPSRFRIERSITINQPVDSVYKQVIDLRKWQQWSPWSFEDTESVNSYAGLFGTPGSRWIWNGKKSGYGQLEITNVVAGNKIITDMKIFEPESLSLSGSWHFEEKNSHSTQVTWVNQGKLGYPFDRWAGLFMERKLGGDYERGLSNLKSVCERRTAVY